MTTVESNLQQAVKQLESMQISNRTFEKTLQTLIVKVLKQARSNLSKKAKMTMSKDPRHAYLAVKHMVYKRILGGNVSILDKRRHGKMLPVSPKPKRYERGGNRIPRSKRTEELLSYYGADRGFILRFLNSGTAERNNSFGRRGRIAPRNWFSSSAKAEMDAAAAELAKLIDNEISKLNK